MALSIIHAGSSHIDDNYFSEQQDNMRFYQNGKL
jgi:hypothetical protein